MNAIVQRESRLQQWIARLRQQHWLSLTLLALHGALMMGLADPMARALLLAHFGFFLLWQPLWHGERSLIPSQVALIVTAAVFAIAAASWWLMALWTAVLLSIVGGHVPGMKNLRERIVSLLAALYLMSILLAWVVPHLFAAWAMPQALEAVIRYGLIVPAALIFFIRTEKAQGATSYTVDLFYSLLLFLMVVVLVLGAFVIYQVSHGNYILALAQALIVIAGLLVALSLIWDPRGGFSGIGQVITRYFLSIGVPFELWMHSLASLAERERDPDKFVIVAAHEMAGLPWLSGVSWQSKSATGNAGEITKYPTEFAFGGLTLKLYTRWSASPALVLHIRLLARLLGDYYEAKVREQEQRRNAYIQAIHETGSRLTHDVKNLLQTLRSLCAAAETSDESDSEAVRLLMKRQLPQITQRLQITLDKLNTKPSVGQDQTAGAQWWQGLRERFSHERIEFDAVDLPADAALPRELFESAAENFLQNALEKRKMENSLRIRASLQWENGFVLSVCDDGTAIPDTIAGQLFSTAVSSKSGLGVGLYQVAKFAREQGYEAAISSNQSGKVCLSLAPFGAKN